MATYIYLVNFTDEGAKGLAEAPKRRAAVRKMVGDLGGEVIAAYLTLGAYDRVIVANFPDEAVAAKFAVGLSKLGILRTTTLLGFSGEEEEEILAKAP